MVSACSGGHLTTYFFKSQIPRGLPGGGGMIAVGFDSYIIQYKLRSEKSNELLLQLLKKVMITCN